MSTDSTKMNALEIEKAAADWFAQRLCGPWADADQARLDAWIDEHLAHRIAYVRVESVWSEMGRLQSVRSGASGNLPPRGASMKWVPAASEGASRAASHRRSRRWRSPRAALAAGAAFMAVTIAWLYLSGSLTPQRHTTKVGRIDTVALADGSNVILNTNSRIRVDITPKERRIELDRGEAFFKVAKDSTRPFIVDLGDRHVVAVGTQFSVRRVRDDIRVIVTEGAVRLEEPNKSQPRTKLLRAGSVARIQNNSVAIEQRPLPQTEEALSWRQGYLVFRDTTLGDAVAEFNRYNSRKLVIADPSIASLRIGGQFRTTSTDAFLWMLQNGFAVSVEEGDRQVVLGGR